MSDSYIANIELKNFSFWEKTNRKRLLHNLEFELTARCNCDCKHCYINLPAGDKIAKSNELTAEAIGDIAEEALSLGGFWCLLTGGEPLLRSDFFEIYLALKRKGFLVSVFTNAALITKEHIELFRKYPPRDIEVSVYGITEETYESVSRKPGSYSAFRRGLDLLLNGGVKVRFKAMALKSNYHEMAEISEFCRQRTKDYFKFDPFLHLRYDGNSLRNKEIKAERLTPDEVLILERADLDRASALKKECQAIENVDYNPDLDNYIFSCTAGVMSATISYDGIFRLCSALWHPDCIYDLKKGSLTEAWENFVPGILKISSENQDFFAKCQRCKLLTICYWCPAHSYLETGKLDQPIDSFCRMAHSRLKAGIKINNE